MSEIILVNNEKDCCGCGACANECPKQAISMKEDDCGFLFPEIDHDKCVECGKCLRICAYKKDKIEKHEPLEGYAAINNDTDMERKSASGGVFSALAHAFIKSGGFISGAIAKQENGSFVIEHIVGNDNDSLEKMQGSKYVQSNSFVAFPRIKELLNNGERVLFCGTPCQVDAVKTITGNPNNLITIDLICHGVPSQKLFRDFISGLERDLKCRLLHFSFRDKAGKEKGFNAAAYSENTKYEIPHALLSYYKLFLNGIIYRENCYSCPYACKERVSDITIGDFWGIEEQHKEEIDAGEIDLGKYWSCILENTDKGKEFLKEYNGLLQLIPSDYKKIAFKNKQLREPSIMPEKRKKYLGLYLKEGYKAVESEFRKNMGGPIKFWIKRKIYIKRHNLGE
ncbi:Coenzyme F420 hydrogenase/dehydrogenase, beta subunit C-terminal domain [Butyrivibrio sp. AD3002]|uniref:Coenzyme F420 hydrogenase/dehydrogenase, beta subunit C-terminal domain n=1 Tax=Butyrivibrio sp. AD3002 TaxID=1280670 RepID=UPI0003B39C49|nr:Coenzyme F420 hydrogenase/dehydrogenase, beta subunit C-terminal domain [Butyrivibrio sp. AD3002]